MTHPTEDFAALFSRWIYEYENDARYKPRRKFNKTRAAQQMGINSSSLSKFANGNVRPLPYQCLLIAHWFGHDVEEALRAAGYPDLELLWERIADDVTIQDAELKQKVLAVLQNIRTSHAPKAVKWRELSWRDSPLKERAEKILASDLDPFQKGVEYVDTLWEWYQLGDKANLSRSERQTDDMLQAIS